MVEGSFDEAVDGVDGVFHSASPVLVPYDENIQAIILNSTQCNEFVFILFFEFFWNWKFFFRVI